MTLQIYPATPIPKYSYNFEEAFKTVVTEYEGENEQRQSFQRFPKRGFGLVYNNLTMAEWLTLHNFFRNRRGGAEPFWFVDFRKMNWVDELVGRGGPYYVDGAVAEDGGVQTDETIAARESTVSDMNLLPATSADLVDCYYFGNFIKFNKIIITLSVTGAGTYIIDVSGWQYYKSGVGWTALSGVTDGTSGFKAAPGDCNVTFTMPSDWLDYDVKNRNIYWVRAKVTTAGTVTTRPKASYAKVDTTYFDLPSKSTVNDSSLKIYVNGVDTAKTFVSGGGGGGADRIYFGGYQTLGALITADFNGYLRMKAALEDKFGDVQPLKDFTSVQQLKLREVWE